MKLINRTSWKKLQNWTSPTGWFVAECMFDYRRSHKTSNLSAGVEYRLILLQGKTLFQAIKSLKKIIRLQESIPLVCGYQHFLGAKNIVPVYDELENGCELLTVEKRLSRPCRFLLSRKKILANKK